MMKLTLKRLIRIANLAEIAIVEMDDCDAHESNKTRQEDYDAHEALLEYIRRRKCKATRS